ncbi:M20/M25/M40 family metallo-hydrolase [Microbacterium sp.]|uniref:M20/M25/M40 family metallo-hydrolase n=1 Tax=Microbacterium sp. TaxID=51671 RepID=UPI003C73C4A7
MTTTLEDEALAFVRDLIRIESVNTGIAETTGDGETRAARYVQERLAEVGIPSEFVESRPGRGSLVARIPGSDPDAGGLLVHAHLDVVPVEEKDWTYPPFGAEIHDGYLYGRGAVDMKDFAGIILAVARHFVREGIVPRRDIVFAFLPDEERGGVWGARWLVEHRPELFAGVTEALSEVGGFSVPLTGEPGDERRAYLAATSEKGSAGVTLTVRGHAAHGSRPTDDNAVVRLAAAVARIGAHRFPLVRTPALQRLLDVFGEARGLEFSDESLREDLASLGFVSSFIDATTRNTATPTVLSAGETTNIIPAEAIARLDVRILPGQDDQVRAELARLAGDDVTVRSGRWWSATEAPIDVPLLDVLQKAISAEDAEGVVVPYLLPAGTDNKHFARLGIHGYGFVPLRVPQEFDVFAQFHAADERVPVDALLFGARVTAQILREA